ncbi:hypothetical protein ASG52_01415 [Methylobacterium sp. Leaf456]|uniref:DUF6065 family protein n=1 Tax=Methylobacterium sp. Leaf456 TaxID=1736382 RepID=UPI000700AC6D|nr:DUF6065 family protein [Methylobacterium sp. Leaf456]KQT61571.1 hypothetical protein ASG52_01415 [Methylobacterium sp. Leaf456]
MDSAADPSGGPARAPRFDIYRVSEHALDIVPGRAGRDWMEATPQGYAKRCLPMVVANASGWDILSPCTFEATWDGTPRRDGLTVRGLDDFPHLSRIVAPDFGQGTLTFRIGLLFRTDPGWGTWLRGPPNVCPDGLHPLEGLIESDWLPFTATMNWRFTRPGSVTFAKGDPIGFVVPIPHLLLDAIQPTIRPLDDDPELKAQYEAWQADRVAVKAAFNETKPGEKLPWPLHYVRGAMQDGTRAPESHLTKRRLKAPR